MSLYLFFITPNLGLIRNFIKYKQFSWKLYIRTPILYLYISLLLFICNQKHILWKTLIFERWFWFIFKSFKSFIKKDHIRKKEKYKTKYQIQYDE